MAYIEKAETNQKIDYIISATRNFIIGNIEKDIYFRICHAIMNTIDEDLKFLADNIDMEDIPESLYTRGLLSSGLLYQSIIDGNGENNAYSFTEIAYLVDEYAVSYNNVEKYPNTGVYNNESYKTKANPVRNLIRSMS